MELNTVLIFIFGLTAKLCDGTCSFPVYLDGTWISSDIGSVDFNSSTVGQITVGSFGNFWFECHQQSGTTYIARSTVTHTVLSQAKYFYLCFDFRYQSDNKYTYYLNTAKEGAASQQRVKILDSSLSPSVSDICDDILPVGSYRILLKDGTIATEKVTCPESLLATFNYTLSGSSCVESLADVCTDNTKISFNYTLCSTKMAYSAGGEVNCLYYTTSGSYTYMTVYNLDASPDESTYFRFTCFVAEVSGSYIQASQYPKYCEATQTPTTVSGAGLTLDGFIATTCPVIIPTTTPKSASSHVTVGVAVLLPVILSAVFGLFRCVPLLRRV